MSIDKEGQTKEIEKFAKSDGVKNKYSTHVRSRITDSWCLDSEFFSTKGIIQIDIHLKV